MQLPKLETGLVEETKNESALGDSPLITPRDGAAAVEEEEKPSSSSALMQKMTQAIQNPTAVRAKVPTTVEDDTKKRGWQERLEKLK